MVFLANCYRYVFEAQESLGEFIIASGHAPITFDSCEEVFGPMPVDRAEDGTVIVRLLRPGMQVFIPLVAALCLRVELS